MSEVNLAAVHDVDSAAEAFIGLMDSAEQPDAANDEDAGEMPVVETEEPEAANDGDIVEEEGDEVSESDESEDSDESEESEEPTYTVKVDGKAVEVTLQELQNGYQRQADYTRKTSDLAEQRKTFEAQEQAIQQERAQYAQALQQLSQMIPNELARFQNVDWGRLKSEDPFEYMQMREEYRETQERIQAVQYEQQRMSQLEAVQNAKNWQAKLAEEATLVKEAIPEFDKVKPELRKYALSTGFSEQEVRGLIDHRSVSILHKAMMYDKMKSAKPQTKKVTKSTVVQKPGAAKTKSEVSSEKRAANVAKVRKTGSIDDAASAIFDLL
jgi:hypothetical protein